MSRHHLCIWKKRNPLRQGIVHQGLPYPGACPSWYPSITLIPAQHGLQHGNFCSLYPPFPPPLPCNCERDGECAGVAGVEAWARQGPPAPKYRVKHGAAYRSQFSSFWEWIPRGFLMDSWSQVPTLKVSTQVSHKCATPSAKYFVFSSSSSSRAHSQSSSSFLEDVSNSADHFTGVDSHEIIWSRPRVQQVWWVAYPCKYTPPITPFLLPFSICKRNLVTFDAYLSFQFFFPPLLVLCVRRIML